MPTTARRFRRRPMLAWTFATALACVFAPAAATPPATLPAHAPPPTTTAPAPCPLGTFNCPELPVSFAMCRPNVLFGSYDPALPTDSRGRANAQTLIWANLASAANGNEYDLSGNVTLRRYDQLLHADELAYNDRTTAYDARGHVTYQDSGMLLAASRVQGTTTPNHAVASHVRYQLLASHGNGTARRAVLVDPNQDRFREVTYSTCPPDHRVWEIRAQKLTTDKATGIGKAHDVTLRLGNVPFLYLPYFTFPLDNRRKTGFLYPTFGHKGNSGYMVSIPYYLNLAPNYDATLTPQLYTRRGLMLGGQFRYLVGSSRGQIDLDYMPNDRHAGSDNNGRTRSIDDGADRWLVHLGERTGLGGNWSFSTSIRRASDKYYFQDYESALKGYTTPSTLQSNAFVRNHGQWWNAAFGVVDYQNVDPALSDAYLQYKRWPEASFNLAMPLTRTLEWGINSEAVAFRKHNAVEGNRLDVYPYLQADYQGAAWFVRPRVAWRYTSYELVNDPDRFGYTNHDPTRSLPITSIDSGLIFERSTKLFGHQYTQTLEPRLYYLYVPYRNQSDLPTFDSRQMTFAWWQLFSPNRFSGADRQMDANNLTAALTTRFLSDAGVQKAAFSLGQIHYFTRQRVQLARNAPPTDFSGSDYVAQASLSLSPSWRVNSVYQWDPDHRRTSVGMLQFQHRLGANGVFNFAYRYRFHFMEQVDASAVIPVSEHWRVLGRWNLALRRRTHWQRGQPKTLAALFGVEYEGCCIAVRLIGRHYVSDVQGDTDNAIMVQIQFKGLGSFNPRTEQFLHHAILGYQ